MKFLRLLVIALIITAAWALMASDADTSSLFLLSKVGGFALFIVAAILFTFYDNRGMLKEDADNEWH